jgi:pimeloyl-ACP methyl ester carboxylesterase
LPGFGKTPTLPGVKSIASLADAVAGFMHSNHLIGADAAGSSMGGRIVLELARRGGIVGGVVALDPGGFWQGWERHAFFSTAFLSIRLLRLLRPALPYIAAHAPLRTLLLWPLSFRPWKLQADMVREELLGYVSSASFDEMLHELAFGEQRGAPLHSIAHPLTIGWGRQDRMCFPYQAKRALELFPDARLHWFESCGHFPHWDKPDEATRLILDATATGNRH